MTLKNDYEPKPRQYPQRCIACGKKAMQPATIDRTSEIKHDGKLYVVNVPDLSVLKCAECGEVLFGNEADEQIGLALRKQLGLLTPQEIRNSREHLSLKQREMAAHLGTAEETISRWENGLQIQSRAMDNLLRLYFDIPEVRARLGNVAIVGNIQINPPHVENISLSHWRFHAEWPLVNLPNENARITGIIRDMLDFSIHADPQVLVSINSIFHAYSKIFKRVDEDLRQMRMQPHDSGMIIGFMRLRQLATFTEKLVEMPDTQRDVLVESMLPLTRVLSDECAPRTGRLDFAPQENLSPTRDTSS